MKNNEKEEDEHPHFVDVNYPEKEPWRTDILFGQRNGFNSHGHMAASGAAIWYLRDEQGKEIIVNGSVVSNNNS